MKRLKSLFLSILITIILTCPYANATQIVIKIPDSKVSDLVDGFVVQYNYKETIEDVDGNTIPNPQTKKQFAMGIIRRFIREVYKASKVAEVDLVRMTAIEEADTYTNDMVVE